MASFHNNQGTHSPSIDVDDYPQSASSFFREELETILNNEDTSFGQCTTSFRNYLIFFLINLLLKRMNIKLKDVHLFYELNKIAS